MNPRVREAMVAIKVIKMQVASVAPASRSSPRPRSQGREPLLRDGAEDLEAGTRSIEFYQLQRRAGSKATPLPAETDGRPTAVQEHRPEAEAPTDAAGVGDEEGQYFKQETDALDYCEDALLEDHLYHDDASRTLLPYMVQYHEAYREGDRLPEMCFEAMNGMPSGTMEKLRPICTILQNLQPAELIPMAAEECPLFFILQGGASVVELLPEVEGARDSGVEGHFKHEVQGFSFYPGKRLHKRYPVGHVLGQASFFLKLAGRVIDAERIPQVFVSARLSKSVEIWALSHADWERVPEDLRKILLNVVCCQMSEDIQHFQLQER
mmetsp:Transcript_19630/g.45625  ORF Transcript_19630/g.45625 Transcript_19630/m.45625 type:complete len:323 (+) Transcript_19630:3-971(+)